MKRARVLLLLIVVAGAVGGGYWFYQSRIASNTSAATTGTTYTQIVQVKQGALNSSVTVVGQLDATQSETLTFSHLSSTTKLATLNVTAGNTVTKSQVLASVDATPYQQALDQAKSDLQSAQKTLADLTEPATALEIAQDDLAIAQAQYQLEEAQSALADVENPDIATLQSNVADAQNALAKAQANLLSLQQSAADTTELYKLQVAEATPSATYNRLAAET